MTIGAKGQGVYASVITMNGKTVDTAYFKHGDLKEGGTLQFALSDTPSGQTYTDEQLPYSMSNE